MKAKTVALVLVALVLGPAIILGRWLMRNVPHER